MSKEEVIKAINDLNDDDDFVRIEAESTIAMNMPAEIDVLHEEVLKEDYILFIQRILENSKNYQRKLLSEE